VKPASPPARLARLASTRRGRQAIYEAAHAVAAHVLGREVRRLSLRPAGDLGAWVRYSAAREWGLAGDLQEAQERRRSLGSRGGRWTRERAAAVLQREFGVQYHPAHISRLMARLG